MSSVLTLKYELVCRTNVSQDEIKHRVLLQFDQELFQIFSNRSFYVYEISGFNWTNISSSLSRVSIDSLVKFRTQVEFVSNSNKFWLKSEQNETSRVDLAQFTAFIQNNPLKILSDLITDFTGLTCNLLGLMVSLQIFIYYFSFSFEALQPETFLMQSKFSGNVRVFSECNSSQECDVNMNCLKQSNELVAKCKCMLPYKPIYTSKTGLFECGNFPIDIHLLFLLVSFLCFKLQPKSN